jgi:ABC-type sugar transport system ATPase subunit
MIGAALEMIGVSKTFAGVSALEDAHLSIEAGEAHALMGANGAGKSTLMNILGGIVAAEGGEIRIAGRMASIASARDARANGIAFVHQELALLASMSVAENVLIEDLPRRAGLIDRAEMAARTQPLLDRLGCGFGPQDTVEKLGMGDRQMVEIARALASNPSILIFDEPTSSLSGREKARLFAVIRKLKAEGTAIIYVTHFIDEIFEICERVTVMRNGRIVGSGATPDFTPGDIVKLMLGDIHQADRLRVTPSSSGEPVLTVTGLSAGGFLDGVSVVLRVGEIVGLWGLLGSGRTEIMRSIVGLDPIDAGAIALRRNGALVPVSPHEAHQSIGFVTEDRRGEGLLLPLSVARNVSFGNMAAVAGRFGLIDRNRERTLATSLVERLKIKLNSVDQPVRTLSGGNQQKVVFSRWLASSPPIFFLDEPTRGLDIGAKSEILSLTVQLATAGAAVLIASSELEELMRVCDRYLIVQRGRIIGELGPDADRDALLAAVSETSASSPSLRSVA